MAHEIAKTADGRDAFAFVGDRNKVWHRLGQQLEPGADLATWAGAAGFDWTCDPRPISYEHNGQTLTAPGHFAMVRSDSGAVLSVMTRRYKPVQPAEVLGFFQDLFDVDDRFTMETAGVLKGGRILFGLAKYRDALTPVGEAHDGYTLLTTSYDGTLATTASATMVRVVCRNTLSMSMSADKGAQIRIPHITDFSRPDVRADVRERLSQVIAGFDKYRSMAEAFASHRLAAHQIEGLFTRLIVDKAAKGDAAREAAPSSKARNQLAALLESYRDTLAEGTTPGTAWAALNAVTRYADHVKTVRDTAGDGANGARTASALYGSGAALKREAIAVLSEIADFAMAA